MTTFHERMQHACEAKLARYFNISQLSVHNMVADAMRVSDISASDALAHVRVWHYYRLSGYLWPTGKRIGRTR